MQTLSEVLALMALCVAALVPQKNTAFQSLIDQLSAHIGFGKRAGGSRYAVLVATKPRRRPGADAQLCRSA
jgi:hypothetical protein